MDDCDLAILADKTQWKNELVLDALIRAKRKVNTDDEDKPTLRRVRAIKSPEETIAKRLKDLLFEETKIRIDLQTATRIVLKLDH